MTRLSPQSGERIDRDRPLQFTFDGRPVSAYVGETIGSALHAAGQTTVSRSFKYHRPRGLMCCSGRCPNCLVEVDGSPGVRACTEPAREGAVVRHLNAWPSLRFDVMHAVDRIGSRLTPPGFYYKTFTWPRRLWPLYRWALRRAAGLGKLPFTQPDRRWRTEYRRRHADVLVVGGGAAGLAAGQRAAEEGLDVVLVDDGPEPGGELLAEGQLELARTLTAGAREAGVEVLSAAPALGYFDGLVPVWQGDALHQIRARKSIVATGLIEQPLMFPGNDLPGVMLAGGARRLGSLYGVLPGRRAVVATCGDAGLEAALALEQFGVEIAAVLDARASSPPSLIRRLEAVGLRVEHRTTVAAARGSKRVTAVDARTNGKERVISCDLLVTSGEFAPASSLLLQAGSKVQWDTERASFRTTAMPEDVLAAGAVSGHGSSELVALSGALAGIEAVAALRDDHELEEERRRLQGQLSSSAPNSTEAQTSPRRRGKSFVCFCEDVTTKDIARCVEEGYDSAELLKRYSTTTMGPCQGRMCQLNATRCLANATSTPVAEVGLTTARPPWSSVPMGVLAGRPFEPAKRSALQARHHELRGNVMWAGDWRRPYDYGDPREEVLAVHRSAGLIDVSTLGKLLVQGPDAAAFLNRLYPNRFDTLAPGRIRYGVLNTDAGRITDDGTVCRLRDDAYYVTTTSSGAEAVEAWFAWWLREWDMDVYLTDVSHGLAAMNLAGPSARRILTPLTELDCSNDAFSYLNGKQAHVSGVPCLMLRIGFVGELGYELHCPSACAGHLWDALIEAGADYELRPFGLEAQRVLRLQKLHILVGQDTDAESTPLEAAMPWIIKLDKEESFIGRWAMEAVEARGAAKQLVGFTCNGYVPTEGAIVLDNGRPAGLVTSARRSPQLDCTIGMAWIPATMAEDGRSFTVSDNGRRLELVVHRAPFFDPDQERLRS